MLEHMSSIILGVGSTNPVKIQAVVRVLVGTNVTDVRGFGVPSGVAAQPLSDEETRQGALQRALKMLETQQEVRVAVGLEGGVFTETQTGQLWSTVWVVVKDRHIEGEWVANGGRFPLPEEIAAGIRAGREMGDVMDDLTGKAQVHQKEGMIGVVTAGLVTRVDAYSSIAGLALGQWWNQVQK
jgi:inosine/xanthosine triphosphatase